MPCLIAMDAGDHGLRRRGRHGSEQLHEIGVAAMTRPAVFLDRDGVLVEEIYYPWTGEWEAPLVPEDVRLLPGAAAAVGRLAAAGFALAVISNQAAYAK